MNEIPGVTHPGFRDCLKTTTELQSFARQLCHFRLRCPRLLLLVEYERRILRAAAATFTVNDSRQYLAVA